MAGLQAAFKAVDTFIEQQMAAAGTPGVAVAVTDRERLRHLSTHGWADIAAQRPISVDTLFEIGSISKSFTAIALLQLSEAGLVDLQAPVRRYLPWFQVRSRYEAITIHHMLSHTAGIISGTEFSGEARFEVWALRETEACTPPGTHFYYSNAGYKALGLVLEAVEGKGYGEIVRERILTPLGMDATEPVIVHGIRDRMAVGYEAIYDDRPVGPGGPLLPATWFESATADGSIASTAGEMATYVRMLLNRGRGGEGRVLSEEDFGLMIQRAIALPEEDREEGSFYGYGLHIGEEDGSLVVSHSGGMVGYYAAIRADLDEGLGVAVLSNGPGDPVGIVRFALQALRAAQRGHSLPDLPAVVDPRQVENASDYAGTYHNEAGVLELTAEGQCLLLGYDGQRLILERHDEDCFRVPHPRLWRFPLRFGRVDGQVVEAFHGPAVYAKEGYGSSAAAAVPGSWTAFPGHYRSHNPWYTNFRIVLRKGRLLLIEPWGEEQGLEPMGDGLFRIGVDARSPERLWFGTILDGRAIWANRSGCDYYRTFTP
ncbi:MAG: serine hydrolase domain-containing protein [Anaerolineae bacterium]